MGVAGVFIGSAGFAGEKIEMAVVPVTVFLDQGSRGFCAEVQSATGDRMFVVCDDATSKRVMEELFVLGKKGEACTVVGEVAGRVGDAERLIVSQTRPIAKATP